MFSGTERVFILKRRLRWCLLVLLMMGLYRVVTAQQVQIWMDGYAFNQIDRSLELESNIGVNKQVANVGWADYYFSNTLTWGVNHWYDLEGSLELHYTYDPEFSNVVEVRPWIGQKFVFTPYARRLRFEKPYFYMRLEQRFLNYTEGDSSDFKMRIRLRLGSRFMINNETMIPGTFFIPFFFEGFINFNGEAFERFASRNRTVIGIGYIFDPHWRTEIVHYVQRSRNSIEDSYTKTDIIFQLKVNYYFIKEKSVLK